jgi:type IV secretory pathway TraG/TraD family ATPase VirD4
VPLMTADQILKLDQGECVFINPAYRGGGEASVPLRLRVKISKREQNTQARSESLWASTVQQRLIARCQKQQTLTDLDAENQLRKEMAERLFPVPISQEKAFSGSFANSDITDEEFDEAYRQ